MKFHGKLGFGEVEQVKKNGGYAVTKLVVGIDVKT